MEEPPHSYLDGTNVQTVAAASPFSKAGEFTVEGILGIAVDGRIPVRVGDFEFFEFRLCPALLFVKPLLLRFPFLPVLSFGGKAGFALRAGFPCWGWDESALHERRIPSGGIVPFF